MKSTIASSCPVGSASPQACLSHDRNSVARFGGREHGERRLADTPCGDRRRHGTAACLLSDQLVFHYLGPAFAVLLFARVDVLGVAWLRIVSAAVIFAA